jgi:rhamnosyltransferase
MQAERTGFEACTEGGGVRLGIVTVTYHPDAAVLRQQMQSLPVEAIKVVVDNSTDGEVMRRLFELRDETPGLELHCNSANVGLAAALDQGVRALSLRASPPALVLLLDQDSVALGAAVAELIDALEDLEQRGLRPGAVGPGLLDPDTGLMHGFHCMTRWRWLRVFPSSQQGPVSVANLNGSGTLMRLETYLRFGGLDRELFIDHVDTEWSFRLLHAGNTLWGVPTAVFRHAMGERGMRVWLLGWRVWPARSPLRHRYLFRNSVWLMRRDYVPRVWKAWCAIKLALTVVLYCVFSPQRSEQLKEMSAGVVEAMRKCPRSSA